MAYQNGVKMPDSKRKVLEEHHGATTERIDIAVRPGDWLVFHIVHNRLRWEDPRYFGVAGLLSPNDFGFVSNPTSSEWSSCDEPVTWGPNHKSENIFNPNRDTFHQIDNAKAAYHLLK